MLTLTRKVFPQKIANETLCFRLRNKVFLWQKQSVSSTDTVLGLLRLVLNDYSGTSQASQVLKFFVSTKKRNSFFVLLSTYL